MIIRMLIRQVVWRITGALLVLFLFGLYFDIINEQEEEVCCHKHYQDWIHIYECDLV